MQTKALELLRKQFELERPLTPDERLKDLPWDSIEALKFLALVDEHFGLQITGDQLAQCRTVGDLLALVGGPPAAKAAPEPVPSADKGCSPAADGIEPVRRSDVPELSELLTAGFHLPPGFDAFSPAVLNWKFFDSDGVERGPASYVVRADGRIAGHLGLQRRTFVSPAMPDLAVPTAHVIDWLSDKGRAAGASLMLKAFDDTETIYGIGGTADARHAMTAMPFERFMTVAMYRRVLHPWRRSREAGRGLAYRHARLARDLAFSVLQPAHRPRHAWSMCPVTQFGDEVPAIVNQTPFPVVMTNRTPELLNYFLRYPGECPVTGWRLCDQGRARGFALLRIAARGAVKLGRIIECYVSSGDPADWHAAYWSVLEHFRQESVDVVSAFANLPLARQALRRCGFHLDREYAVDIWDPKRRLPRAVPYYFSMLEGDNGLFL
jgi:acyl carrier protein